MPRELNTVGDLATHLATLDQSAVLDKGPATNEYFYPTICALVDRPAALAIGQLAAYVRPDGDFVLTRSMLDDVDRGLSELEAILAQRWNGFTWSRR